jgi:hypothetical protein
MEGTRIDDDLVCQELHYGSHDFKQWEVEQRVRFSDILANRLNMRRAIRELVLPELATMQQSLAELSARFDRVEAALTTLQRATRNRS